MIARQTVRTYRAAVACADADSASCVPCMPFVSVLYRLCSPKSSIHHMISTLYYVFGFQQAYAVHGPNFLYCRDPDTRDYLHPRQFTYLTLRRSYSHNLDSVAGTLMLLDTVMYIVHIDADHPTCTLRSAISHHVSATAISSRIP